MLKAIKKRLMKSSWQTDASDVIYTKAMTYGIYYATEDKRFAWWGKQTYKCTPSDPNSYNSVLEKYREAYSIWQEFLDLKNPASFLTKWGDYTWSDFDNGDRKVGIKSLAYGGNFLSAYGDGTMRPTATTYSGASELFRLTPAPGNSTPDAWMIRNSGGSYLNREYNSSNYKFTGRVIFSGNGSTLGLTTYIWYTMPVFGGICLYVPSSPYNIYTGILPDGIYSSTPQKPLTAPPPNSSVIFIDVNHDPNPTSVAASNIALWNSKVIPTLLSMKVDGRSPLVDPGEIGTIARKWEADLENVDSVMVDQLKVEYCAANPTFKECECLSARFVDPTYAVIKLSAPDGCWYTNCSGQLADGKTLITRKMVDDRKSCPDVCQSLIRIVNSVNVSLKDVRNITTCTIPDKKEEEKEDDVVVKDDTGSGGMSSKQKKTLIVGVGSGVAALSTAVAVFMVVRIFSR